MKKAIIITLITIVTLILLGAGAVAWVLFGGVSNPANRKTIGKISTPWGFERVEVPEGSFGEFIREFPLKPIGSKMRYFDGRSAYFQNFAYAVLDLEMLSNHEQCADAVMRMHSEYLWKQGRSREVTFNDYQGKAHRYSGSADRKAFEKYLCYIFDVSNTGTLRKQLSKKDLKDIQPGDVLVYPASNSHRSGHAVLVADVAINKRTGQKAIMIAQSSTPAITMHIIRDMLHPITSPWVIIDDNTSRISISRISFSKDDLRRW